MAENILKHPQFDSIADQYEKSLGLPQGVLRSLVYQESRGNPSAVSPVGARGVAQFMPATAKAYNVNADDPWDSLRGAAEYLGDSVKKYGSIEAALAEYNGGPRQAKLVAAGQQPAAKETAKYVPEVLSRLPQANAQIAQQAAAGDGLATQVQTLREAGFKDWIDDAKSKGASNEEIVQILAAQGSAAGRDAKARRDAKSFVSNAVEGAGDMVGRLWRGGKQIVASGDEEARLKAEEAADRSNLDNIALRSTAGAKVGGAAPLVLGALIPGADTVVGGIALGAAAGALQPTVEGESRFDNAALGGLTGGGGVVAGKVVNGALNGTVKAAQAAARGGRSVQEVAKAYDDAVAAGLNPSLRELSPTLNKVANYVDSVPGANIGQGAKAATREEALAQQLLSRTGTVGNKVDGEVLDSVLSRLGSEREALLQGRAIKYEGLASKLDDVVAAQEKHLPSMRSSTAVKVADELKAELAAGPVKLTRLNEIRSQIGKMTTAADDVTRDGLNGIRDAIDQGIKTALSKDGLAKYNQINDQFKHAYALKNLVATTNDGAKDITAGRLASAIKQRGFKNAYTRGEAPYQDIQKALGGLETASGSGIQTSQLLQGLAAVHTGGMSLLAGGGAANFAKRVLESRDPRVIKALLGLTPVKQAELKRLALAAALSTQG